MIRRLPIRCASKPWPTALLILCAPVCARSSRFSHTAPEPIRAAKRLASYSGVGRPTYVLSRRLSSAWNAASLMAARKPASSSSRAGMMVSGTYCPPYGPNRPRLAVVALVGAMVIAAYGLQKSSDKARIFAAGRELDAAAHVDAEWRQAGERGGDVVGLQAAGDEAARPYRAQGGPVEGAPGAAGQTLRVRVQKVPVGPQRVLGDHPRGGGFLAGPHVEGLDGGAWHRADHVRGLVARELDEVEVAQIVRLGHFLGRGIDEDAHGRPVARVGPQRADDAGRLGRRDVALARLPEDEAQEIGAGLQGDARLGQRAQAAHLDQGHAGTPRAAPAATSRRSCSPGSLARSRLSPTSTASAPTSRRLAICSGVETPLSATNRHAAGTSGRRRGATLTSVTSVSRTRLLTPITRAPASRARRTSSAEWVSTNASMSRLCVSARRLRSSGWVSARTMRSTASAPRARASYTWYSSTTKSFRRTGSPRAARASTRSWSVPPK